MAEKLITKSFERLLDKGKHRGFITYEELGKSLGKRNSTNENIERAFIINVDEKITFRVQIAASSKRIASTPENFNGLSPIKSQKSDGLIRYFYGGTTNYKAAQKLKKTAIRKGYPNAFVVAFRNGKKIKISEAISQ